MAVESGPGLFGVDASSVAAAISAQAASQAAAAATAAALKVEYDSLTEYKKMVTDLLDDLTGSNADHKKLAHGTLPAGKLGHGFPEAEAMFKSYDTVITELQKLSKGLADQIEALGIAISTAGKGFGDVDDDTQRRMVAIAKDAEKHYVPERDPYLEEQRRLAASHGTGGNATGGSH
ncbi:hypothetical protein [Streptomyces sp. NPDC057010]|uniref:hypothetical protein n=1 Tax=Streptomyces sp. NPDC057010 TaxID=3345997 RepID=UPI00363AC107